MKQYDKIYIPINPGEHVAKTPWILEGGHIKTDVQEYSSVIVLTIEELREVWQAGERAKHFEANPNAKYIDFNSYMERKGIK